MDPLATYSYATAALLSLYPLQRAAEVWRRERRWEGHLASLPTLDAASLPIEGLMDRFAGCLIGGAIGDGLGRMSEALPTWAIRLRFGTIRDFQPGLLRWARRRGSVTDDTQLTLCVAQSLDATGRFDETAFARTLVAWLPYRVGPGKATVASARRLQQGVTWSDAGDSTSAGNGSVTRLAPIALLWHADAERRGEEAERSARGTHGNPLALSGTRLVADALAYVVNRKGDTPGGLIDVLASEATDPVWVEGLRLLQENRHRTIAEGLALTGRSGFVKETVLAALWLFQQLGESPAEAISAAVNHGGDTDSIGALVGNLVGAWHGYHALPERWRREVQGSGALLAEARRLHDLHS